MACLCEESLLFHSAFKCSNCSLKRNHPHFPCPGSVTRMDDLVGMGDADVVCSPAQVHVAMGWMAWKTGWKSVRKADPAAPTQPGGPPAHLHPRRALGPSASWQPFLPSQCRGAGIDLALGAGDTARAAESRSGSCGHRAERRVPVACLPDRLPQPLPPPAPAQTFPANLGGWARAPPPCPAVQPSSARVLTPAPAIPLLPRPPSAPPGSPPHLPAPLHLPRSLRLSHSIFSPRHLESPPSRFPRPAPSLAPPPSPRPLASPRHFSVPTTFVLLPSALSPYIPIPSPLPAAPAPHFLAPGSRSRSSTPLSSSPTATPGVSPPFVSAPAVEPLAGP